MNCFARCRLGLETYHFDACPEARDTVRDVHPLTILVLDGSTRAHELSATLINAIQARLVSVSNMKSLSTLAKSCTPDVAIFGAEHSAADKRVAEQLLRALNPEIKIIDL
jgi:hypothetical protein